MESFKGNPFLVLWLILPLLVFSQTNQTIDRKLELGVEISDSLGATDLHRFYCDLDSGWLFLGTVDQISADVVITVKGPDSAIIKVIDGLPGPEKIEFEILQSGCHWFELTPFQGTGVGTYAIRMDSLLSPEVLHTRWQAELAMEDSVSNFIRQNAIRLNTVEAGSGFEDLQPLKKLIGDARIVGLGEATHGTREFFQFKHRMLEFLVSEMGFTAFVIEAIMPECFDINQYVLTGEGDAGKALAAQYFWTWDTQEVLALIEWMRQYNSDPVHTRKIRFYGNDMQECLRAAKVTANYLEKVDPAFAKEFRDSLSYCLNGLGANYLLSSGATKGKRNSMRVFGEVALKRFEKNKNGYMEVSSPSAYSLVHRHLSVLIQFLRLNSADGMTGSNTRDSSMAENTRWALENEGPKGKVVLWAHNYHVSGDSLAQGWYLDRMFGDDYYKIGMIFNQGKFQARLQMVNNLQPLALDWFQVPPLGRGSAAWAFKNAGLKFAVLDLRQFGKNHLITRWFSSNHSAYNRGALFSDSLPGYQGSPTIYSGKFDALLFVDSTNAALANPWISVGYVPPVLPILSNGDFELLDSDSLPKFWDTPTRIKQFEYKVSVSSISPQSGKTCLLMERPVGHHYGEGIGRVTQSTKAKMFRGKVVQLSVFACLEPIDDDSHAYIRLSGDVSATGPEYCQMLDSTIAVEINSSDWKLYELQGKVSDSAKTIDIGLYFVGEGKAWFDAVALSIEEPY